MRPTEPTDPTSAAELADLLTDLLIDSEKVLEDIFADVELWEAIRQEMVAVAWPIFREAFMVGAELGAEERASLAPGDHSPDDVVPVLGFRALPFDRPRVSRVADNLVGTYTDTWWTQFSRSTQNSLRRSIQRSADQGTGVAGVITDITPLFGKKRAKLIAVSEVTNLMGMGAHETYREAGYREWEWRTVRDGRVDPTCQNFDKKVFPMSLKFERAHPGCRCWPVPAGMPEGFGELNFDTKTMHTRNGRWTRERVKLHDQIVRDMKQGATPVGPDDTPQFHMMGGGPASGKSTVTKKIDLGFPSNRVTIDSDAIKLKLPEYQKMFAEGDARAAAFAHEESSYLTKRIVAETTRERYNVLLDGTGDSGYDKLVKKLAGYQAEGHEVIAEYMTLDTDLAWKIANARAKATGRFVPESVVRETHATISEVLPRVAREGRFNKMRLWDTNIEGSPRLIAQYGDDGFKVLDDDLWQTFISKANPSTSGYEQIGGSFSTVGEVPGAFVQPMKITSLNLHTDARGVWTIERKRLHDRLIKELKDEATPVGLDETPSFHMMGGGPASGKTTVTKKIDLGFPKNRLNIDADEIKLKLPEYKQMLDEGNSNAAVFVHDESTYLQQRLAIEAIGDRYNILLDGTGDNGYEHLTRQLANYRAHGLDRLEANYMSLDTDLAVKIADIRLKATGRGVPEHIIREKHASISEVLPRMSQEGWFDRMRLWDTNIEGVPRLIAEYDDGVWTIHNEGLWQRFLSKANPGSGYEATGPTGRTLSGETLGHIDEANTLAGLTDLDVPTFND